MLLVIHCENCGKAFQLDNYFFSLGPKVLQLFDKSIHCCKYPNYFFRHINTHEIQYNLIVIKIKARTFNELREELLVHSI